MKSIYMYMHASPLSLGIYLYMLLTSIYLSTVPAAGRPRTLPAGRAPRGPSA